MLAHSLFFGVTGQGGEGPVDQQDAPQAVGDAHARQRFKRHGRHPAQFCLAFLHGFVEQHGTAGRRVGQVGGMWQKAQQNGAHGPVAHLHVQCQIGKPAPAVAGQVLLVLGLAGRREEVGGLLLAHQRLTGQPQPAALHRVDVQIGAIGRQRVAAKRGVFIQVVDTGFQCRQTCLNAGPLNGGNAVGRL